MNQTGRFVAALERIFPPERLVMHADGVAAYESDALVQHKGRPVAVVLPESVDEIRAVVRACHAAAVPWVSRGAGTGLSGGATPVDDGIVIALSRMRRVLEVDLDNERVTVEPGVTTAEVSDAVAPSHFFPPDPSSRNVCSIGGNVAENAGGAHCLKYGFTANYVTGLELVLPDGELVELGGEQLDPPGLDLVGVFVGSEGTLGIATRIILRVVPVPEATGTLVAYFGTIEQAGRTVSAIIAAGIVPAAMEIMDRLTLEATAELTGAKHRGDFGAALIVEVDGPTGQCDSDLAAVMRSCEEHAALEIRAAADEAERELIWRTRRSAFEALSRRARNLYLQDGVVPRTRLPDVLRRIDELAKQSGLRVANVAHAGDGNVHPLVLYDAQQPGEAARAQELTGSLLAACMDAGGSITGEHGIGLDKKQHMGKMFSEADLDAFGRLRCSFDPEHLANPGKLFPTPRLCGEVPGPYRVHPLEVDGTAERF